MVLYMKKLWLMILCFQSLENIGFGASRIETTDDIISQTQKLDLKIMMNNIIVKSKANGIRTKKHNWFENEKYFKSITEEIPLAINQMLKNKCKENVFTFGDLDLSNYTQGNYNALFLYNLVKCTIEYLDAGYTDGKVLLERTKNVIEENFKNIDLTKLQKSLSDIRAYDKEFNIIRIVDELWCLKRQINLARQGKNNGNWHGSTIGSSAYITKNSDLVYNIKSIDNSTSIFNLPRFDYLILNKHKEYPFAIEKIELCFKIVNGIVKIDIDETCRNKQEHNELVRENRRLH